MDIEHLMTKPSMAVRAALSITSLVGRALVEADNIRRERVPPPDPGDLFEARCATAGVPLEDLNEVLHRFTEGETDAIDQAPASLRPYLRLWQVCSLRSKETPHTTTPVNDATYRAPSSPVPPGDRPGPSQDQDATSIRERVAHLEQRMKQLADDLARVKHTLRQELSTARLVERVQGVCAELGEC